MSSRKSAITDYPVLELIKNRWSPRSFSPEPVKKEILFSLFEAARWAPSAYNEQPWHFIVAHKEDNKLYPLIINTLVPFNKQWASFAPVLIVCVASKFFSHNGKPNSYASYDCGQAVAYLTMQALSHDIYVHQMGGFDKESLRNNLKIPDDKEIINVMALGYRDTPDKLSEEMKKTELAERQRKKMADWTVI
ncbi:MAG: malonic semialdehyde reductase [Bacteroidetes bacterium ADurb.Bin408]|nr:MAG: malonic semialdehyde reductase [Bacteroidetes bacterium ADurb.Bin408]